MKLIIEQAEYSDLSYSTVVNENTNKKDYIVEGIFMQAERVNRNKRLYPKNILEREVRAYQSKIQSNESLGELNHPNAQDIDYERASHIIKELYMKGNNVYGKAKILDNTIGKNIIKPLLDEGVKIGMSSRALGSLIESGDGEYKIVQEDYKLICVDCVSNPSAHDAYVSLMESCEFFIENGIIKEKKMDELTKALKSLKKDELKEGIISIFQEFINSIKV